MTKKKTKKPGLIEMVDARLRELGAKPNDVWLTSMYKWRLETKFGPLYIDAMENWIAMRFGDIERARERFGDKLGNRFSFNPYSGKYNVQTGEGVADSFRIFTWKLDLAMECSENEN